MEIGVTVDAFSSPVSSGPDTFMQVYLTSVCVPKAHVLSGAGSVTFTSVAADELALVCILYCHRMHEGVRVTKQLGSAMLDLSAVGVQSYTLHMHDASMRPPLSMGHANVRVTLPAGYTWRPCSIQHVDFPRALFAAAEANLNTIEGFGPHGLPAVTRGLRLVHSPYYVNHLGLCLPAGAFCMIKTTLEPGEKNTALDAHRARLDVALARNGWSHDDFVHTVRDLCTAHTLDDRTQRCLATVVDFITLHTRVAMHYMPDVALTPTPESTERWEVPREPTTVSGTQSFVGDCEDYAREVYHQCCEIRDWQSPSTEEDALAAVSAVLHMYVPTIEQGAVDRNAVSAELRRKIPDAEYRNHIWAALHPRHHWRANLKATSTGRQKMHARMQRLYAIWPKQPCESALPMLHAEGTADVYPIVLDTCPAAVRQRAHASKELPGSTDFSLASTGRSDFYKYAIACMTDVFADAGWLDYTYISDGKYGCPVLTWAQGKYRFRPSCTHSDDTMAYVRKAITYDRPIGPIRTMSTVEHAPTLTGAFVRYTQGPPGDTYGKYVVDGQPLYEQYKMI